MAICDCGKPKKRQSEWRQCAHVSPKRRENPNCFEYVTQASVSQEEFQVLMVHSLGQVAPPAGVFVYSEPQAEGNGEQDGEQRSRRIPCNIQE
jgi:hypothetical protein